MPNPTPNRPYNFDLRLQEAAGLLHASERDVVSVKFRPITKLGTFEQTYLGSNDYDVINQALREAGLHLINQVPSAMGGNTTVHAFDDGYQIIYVEHESGPEIFLHDLTLVMGAVGSTALAASQVLNLFNQIVKKFQKAPVAQRDASGRFIATSIEKRTARGQKVIKQVENTSKAISKAVKKIEEILGDDIN